LSYNGNPDKLLCDLMVQVLSNELQSLVNGFNTGNDVRVKHDQTAWQCREIPGRWLLSVKLLDCIAVNGATPMLVWEVMTFLPILETRMQRWHPE